MKNIGKIVAISAILGFLILMVFPVNALPARSAQLSGEAGDRLSGHLDRLEEQGYDMSSVRAAIESGDYEAARMLMQQFMEEHKDELPMPPAGGHAGNGERLSGHLDRLEEQGYDMTAVRAAIESGDYETARMLMQQFMEEHKDELPVPPEGDRAGKGERMRPGMAS
jgi:DNA-binding GntR family transcriptional regulator